MRIPSRLGSTCHLSLGVLLVFGLGPSALSAQVRPLPAQASVPSAPARAMARQPVRLFALRNPTPGVLWLGLQGRPGAPYLVSAGPSGRQPVHVGAGTFPRSGLVRMPLSWPSGATDTGPTWILLHTEDADARGFVHSSPQGPVLLPLRTATALEDHGPGQLGASGQQPVAPLIANMLRDLGYSPGDVAAARSDLLARLARGSGGARAATVSPYELAVMAKEAYQSTGFLLPSGWSSAGTFQAGGFFAALFVDHARQALVFAIRGTDDPLDIIDDIRLATGAVPLQAVSAVVAFFRALDMTAAGQPFAGYSMDLTGHSLGAFLCDTTWVAAALFRGYVHPVVTFDNPGSFEHIRQFLGSGIRAEDLPFVQYQAAPNFVNTALEHGGAIVRVYPDYDPQALKSGRLVTDFIDFSLRQHAIGPSMRGIVGQFDPATGLPKVRSDQTATWPQGALVGPVMAYDRFRSYEETPHYWELFFDKFNVPQQTRTQFVIGSLGGGFNGFGPGHTIVGDDGDNAIWGSTGRDDVLVGNGGNDTILGYGGDDVLIGGDGDDVLDGGDNPVLIDGTVMFGDLLEGGPGADVLDGNRGDADAATYENAAGPIAVDLGAGQGTLGEALGDRLISIEAVFGSPFDDVLTGSGNGETLEGRDGNDTISAPGGINTLRGEGGDDHLTGGSGPDRIEGGPGSDVLTGGAERDRLTGGDGDDTVAGGDGDDIIDGGDGVDVLHGGNGDDTIDGGADADTITGDDGSDDLDGGDGNDSLDGGPGDDVLDGGAGDDLLVGGDGDDRLLDGGGTNTLRGGAGRDRLTGGQGTDTLEGGDDDDTLRGGPGADALDGGNGIDVADYRGSSAAVSVDLEAGTASGGDASGDTLTRIESLVGSDHDDVLAGDANDNSLSGELGDDTLAGGGGRDRLTGGGGDDVLDGGAGPDTLVGDGSSTRGADRFVIASRADSTGTAPDLIADFEQGKDRIVLSGLGFSGIQAGMGVGSTLGYTFQSGGTVVADATGGFVLRLGGSVPLTASDFVF